MTRGTRQNLKIGDVHSGPYRPAAPRPVVLTRRDVSPWRSMRHLQRDGGKEGSATWSCTLVQVSDEPFLAHHLVLSVNRHHRHEQEKDPRQKCKILHFSGKVQNFEEGYTIRGNSKRGPGLFGACRICTYSSMNVVEYVRILAWMLLKNALNVVPRTFMLGPACNWIFVRAL